MRKGLILAITLSISLTSVTVFTDVFANTIDDKYKIHGVIKNQDNKIFIVNHMGYSMFEPLDENYGSDSIIYGDIVNLSEDTLYYIIVRGNVYKNNELWEKTGIGQKFTFRHNYSPSNGNPTELAISPLKMTLKPGEASPFSLWPGQSGWDCYEVWIESYELENSLEGITDEILRNDMIITDGKLDNKGTFTGKIKNPTQNSIKNAFVNIIKYDEENTIFGIRGVAIGTLGPETTRSFTIPVFLSGMQIKTHTDNFLYGKPANFEVLAWGYEDDRSQIKTSYGYPGDLLLSAESMYFPDKKMPDYMNFNDIKLRAELETQKNTFSKSCTNTQEESKVNFQDNTTNITTLSKIPDWVKNNAKWWSDGQVDDSTFSQGIGFLIKEKVISVSSLPPPASAVAEEKIPDWIKNNAKWWADGMISEDDFLKGITYMVEKGIIRAQ